MSVSWKITYKMSKIGQKWPEFCAFHPSGRSFAAIDVGLGAKGEFVYLRLTVCQRDERGTILYGLSSHVELIYDSTPETLEKLMQKAERLMDEYAQKPYIRQINTAALDD